MTSVKKYVYNEDGIRTSKTSNGVTTKFLLDGYNVIEQTDGTTTLHFFYDSNGEVIGFRYNENDYFYVKNAMSDIIAITDSNKNIVAEYRYDPWDKVLNEDDLTAIGNLNPFRYRSYYYDSDIEMYYLQSRYYDAEVGRFINCDDVNYIGITESEVSYNPFAYCESNPINNVDWNGKVNYRIIQTGYSWRKIIDSLLRNCSVLYRDKSYYPDYYVVYGSNEKVSLVFSKNSNSRRYLKQRAQEIYYYKTYTEWCYYISLENKNFLENLNNKAIEKIAKIWMNLNKKLDLKTAKRKIEERLNEFEDVLVPLIDDTYSLSIGYALDIISIASYLIDKYYSKFSKEVKYISGILKNIGKKYQKDKYCIFIPYFIYYESQVFCEVSYNRSGVRWRRDSTYKFYKRR